MDKKTADSQVGEIMATPGMAEALDDDRFKQFLDHLPVAIAVSQLQPLEAISYINLEFERLTGLATAAVIGKDWRQLPGIATPDGDTTPLGSAVTDRDDFLGSFSITRGDTTIAVDAWSNTIADDYGTELFRLVALADRQTLDDADDEESGAVGEKTASPQKQLRDKDAELMELQHRVKNNLQMITALVRMEARSVPKGESGERFERLAGRIGALSLLYETLSGEGVGETVDLGSYLGLVAASIMRAHSTDGIRLETRLDSWPVAIDIAMSAGLVVNELITNCLKHAFAGRPGGTISLSSTVDATGCRVTVTDDGVGLAEGKTWPTPGRLGAAIARSLVDNARAKLHVTSDPATGVRVEIYFTLRDAQAPAAAL